MSSAVRHCPNVPPLCNIIYSTTSLASPLEGRVCCIDAIYPCVSSAALHAPLSLTSPAQLRSRPSYVSKMDPNNRLNFNLGGYNERTYTPMNERAYPTTPSTFPQPIFGNQQGQGAQMSQEYLGSQLQSPNGYSSGAGYFMNSPYQPHYGQQQQSQYQSPYQQQNIQSPQPSYQQRQGGYATTDATNGLVNQFSNQNLGNSARQNPAYGRHPSPSQRPHTAGATGQQQLSNHLVPPIPGYGSTSRLAGDEEPPERNPEKYSSNIAKRGKVVDAMVKSFFEQNVQRARERNIRYAPHLGCCCSRVSTIAVGAVPKFTQRPTTNSWLIFGLLIGVETSIE